MYKLFHVIWPQYQRTVPSLLRELVYLLSFLICETTVLSLFHGCIEDKILPCQALFWVSKKDG